MIAPPVSAQKTLLGRQVGDARAHGVNDAPTSKQGAKRHGGLTAQHDPERHMEAAREVLPWANSRTAMTPMVFCASLPPVSQRIERGGDELQPP